MALVNALYSAAFKSETDLWVVQHVELLSSVSPGVQHDGLLASRMVRHELRIMRLLVWMEEGGYLRS